MPASRAISVIPRARATSPRAAAIRLGSPSSKAAARYSLTSSGVFSCSAGSQGSVSRAISVFLCQLLGVPDVTVLRALVAAAEQYDNVRAAVYEVDAVSGSVVDPQLRNARPNGTHVAGVPQREAPDPDVDPSDGGTVAQALKPLGKRRGLPDLDHLCNLIHKCVFVEPDEPISGEWPAPESLAAKTSPLFLI